MKEELGQVADMLGDVRDTMARLGEGEAGNGVLIRLWVITGRLQQIQGMTDALWDKCVKANDEKEVK